jgi:hypothetical protein
LNSPAPTQRTGERAAIPIDVAPLAQRAVRVVRDHTGSIAMGAQTLIEHTLVDVTARGHGLAPAFSGRRGIYRALRLRAGTQAKREQTY